VFSWLLWLGKGEVESRQSTRKFILGYFPVEDILLTVKFTMTNTQIKFWFYFNVLIHLKMNYFSINKRDRDRAHSYQCPLARYLGP
jgi:hypothetical protein